MSADLSPINQQLDRGMPDRKSLRLYEADTTAFTMQLTYRKSIIVFIT